MATITTNVPPTFFSDQKEFRKWLEKNHQKAKELFVGFYKVGSGRPSITWPQSVDEALCFGWIDGVRKSLDEHSYFIRFTPRKPKSIWSAVNIKKIEVLTEKGLMYPAGFAAYQLREESKSKIYSYEMEETPLSTEFEKTFKANKKAWAYFQSMPSSYRKPVIHWVMGAKQESTKARRLVEVIKDSEAEKKIKRLSY